ncbi:MAG TPA: polysaccharide biosynthesis tyrosine autokinase [Gemmatimonadaceae bacterium]|nr:polysaccharide biosynthesis tyrosine autokinase [Gemmatimonadaceae bacterium]
MTDYLKVLYKRRWTAATAFLLIVGTVTIYTFTVTPIFEAKTRLLIESDERNVVSFKQVVEEDQTKADYYQTQYNILQSRVLARKTLDSLKLWNKQPFGGEAEKSFSLTKSVLGIPGALMGLFKSDDAVIESSIPAADETIAQSRAIDRFLAGLTVAPIRNSRLVDVKYQLPDGAQAASIVNTLAKNYIEQNLEYKFMASKEASDWLGERLGEQRKQVEQAEVSLQRYREQNDAIAMEDTQNIVVQKLSDLNAAVTRAKTERIQKESMYQQLQASQSNPAMLDTFPAILTNSFIQQQKSELAALQQQQGQLAEKLGDKHPDLIKIKSAIQLAQLKLNGEIAKVVQSVRSEYQAALAQENSLTSALNQQKGEALSMNRKAIDYGVLDRDVQSSKQIYDSLMQRAKETGVAGELKTSNIRVVDLAEQPRRPVRPQKRTNLLLALFGGTLLACGLVFFFEYVDSRIKNPEEIRAHLGLAHLGLLPSVDSKAGYPLLHNGVAANFSESFRAIRTNVLFSSADKGSRSMVVTSTGPGEGKSMVAANLAVSLAQAGQRVLLIDADMRKPKVHEIFGVAQEPGFSNVLVGDAKASEAVRETPVNGLWTMTAGRIPPNPAELLGSVRCRDFVESLKGHFDWVILDSPPIMAVTDAALLAHYATGVVFVVGAEMTSRHAAKRALEQLETANARFVGAILNRVDLERNAYYYSQYYRREYSEYYAKTS